MQQLTAFVTCKSKIIARIYVTDAFSLEINAFALFCFMVLIMESLKLEKKPVRSSGSTISPCL